MTDNPFKPRPRLFVSLLLVLVAWSGLLLYWRMTLP
jgi:hypothetical protein